MDPLRYRDQTVLITGASSGLGAEFARRLAERGAHLVLVARRAERLESLAAELSAAHGVRVETIPLDLAEPGPGHALRAQLSERGIAVTALINNAGYAVYEPFSRSEPEALRAEVAVDVAAVVDLTREFIGDLQAAPGGFLVNLASVAAYQPTPGMAVYGASKAFVLSFTEALWEESRGTGLRVLAVSPGPTETEFFEIAGEGAGGGLPRMSAEAVVAHTLRTLERPSPPPSTVPGASNRALTTATRLVPRRALARSAGAMMTERPAGAERTAGSGPDGGPGTTGSGTTGIRGALSRLRRRGPRR